MLIVLGISFGSTVIVLALAWHYRWVLRMREFWTKGIRLRDDPVVGYSGQEQSPKAAGIGHAKSSDSIVQGSTDSSSDASGSTGIMRLLAAAAVSDASANISAVNRDIEEGLARNTVQSASEMVASWKQQALSRIQSHTNAVAVVTEDPQQTEITEEIPRIRRTPAAVHEQLSNKSFRHAQDDFKTDSGDSVIPVSVPTKRNQDSRIGIGPLCMCF